MKKCVIRMGIVLLCMVSQVAFSATSDDYFPLNAGTVWRYITDGGETVERIVLKKKVMVNGVETSVVKYVDENLRVYFSSDSNGIFLHREYEPSVYVQGYGWTSIDATFVPPVKFGDNTFDIGDFFHSEGTAITRAAGRTFNFGYTADTTIEEMETISVPAGTFVDTIRFRMELTLTSAYGSFTIISIQNFAEGMGIVKDVTTDTEGVTSTEELVYTNAGIYDLAITSIAQPKKITLSSGTPSKTSLLKVKIQNKGPFPEIIEDATMLTNLITLTVESLGACPAPSPILHAGKPQKSFPITLKPGKTLTVYYDVTFDCANYPAQGTPDYLFSAIVNRATLDGKEDTNPLDDMCPRSGTSPKDKGCGARKPDGTLGGDILTDVVDKSIMSYEF